MRGASRLDLSRPPAAQRRGRSARGAPPRRAGAAALLALAAALGGCTAIPYEPERATRPYPRSLHEASNVVDIQVFRDGDDITLVNATTTSYGEAVLWLNQRYMHEIPPLPAGSQATFPLSEFWDLWGGSPERGGLFRRFDPTPIRLVQIQIDDTRPLVGLVVIPAEEPKSPIKLQG